MENIYENRFLSVIVEKIHLKYIDYIQESENHEKF